MLRNFALVLTVAAATQTGVATDSLAQSRKKATAEKSEQSSQSTSGYPPCEGTLFMVYDSGSGPTCRRRDGKLCQVNPGTGGRAELANCR